VQPIETILDQFDQYQNAPGDIESMLKHVATGVKSYFEADWCLGLGFNPFSEHRAPRHTHVSSVNATDRLTPEFIPGLTALARTLFTDAMPDTVLVLDEEQLPSAFQNVFRARTYIAIIVPVKHKLRPLAICIVGLKHTFLPAKKHMRDVRLLVRQAGALLASTWNNYRYQEVLRIGREINHDLTNAATLFQRLARATTDILDISYAMLLSVYKPQEAVFDHYFTEHGTLQEKRSAPFIGICRYVLEHKQPLIINHFSQEQATLPIDAVELSSTATTEESLLFVPLMFRDTIYGILSVQHQEPHHYDEHDQLTLQLLANHTALALNNIFLYNGLRRLAQSGEKLTRDLASPQVQDAAVNAIREATRADLVILFRYEQTLQQVLLPPYISGVFRHPEFPLPSVVQPDDMTNLVLRQEKPIFATNSKELYERLGGKMQLRNGDFEAREQIASTVAMTLKVGEEPIGVLFVNFRNPQRFDAAQKLLIEGHARYAAIAIKNARSFSDVVQRRLHELEVMSRIDQTISDTTSNLSDDLHAVLKILSERFPVDVIEVLLFNAAQDQLEVVARISTYPSATPHPISIKHAKGVTREAFLNRQSIRVGNVHTQSYWKMQYIATIPDVSAELAVPIIDGDTVLGVLNLESTQIDMFSEEDEGFLLAVAGRIAQVIKNVQAYERERKLANESRALVEIGNEIAAQLNQDSIFELILDKALQLTNSRAGNLMLYDSRRNDLWMAAGKGQNVDPATWRQQIGEGVVGYVAKTRELLNIDIREEPWAAMYRAAIPGMCYELAVPLLEASHLRGVINVERDCSLAAFDEHNVRMLKAFADLAVIAVQNAERYWQVAVERERLEALHNIDEAIIRQIDDVEHVMRTVLQAAIKLTNADQADLHLYEKHVVRNTFFAQREKPDDSIAYDSVNERDIRAPQIQRGIITYVTTTRKPYYTYGDAQDDPHYRGAEDIHSEIAVPLLDETGTLIGVLNLESREPYTFGPEEVYVLTLLAGQAVIAIQNAQSYARAAREVERFQVLHRAGRELAAINNLSEVDRAYEIIIGLAHKHSHSQTVLRRLDPQSQSLRMVKSVPEHVIKPVESLPPNQSVTGKAILQRRTQVVHDVTTYAEGTIICATPAERSLVVIPVLFNEHVFGTMTLMHEQADHFVDTDVQLFEGLAQQLALALDRLESVRAQRETDVMASIGQLSVELAHRLGNHLGLILPDVRRLQSELEGLGVLNEHISRHLANIIASRDQAIGIVKSLRTLQTINSNTEPELIAIPDLLDESLAASVILPPTIKVQRHILADLPRALAHRQQVIHILNNLFTNAIQAVSPAGVIVVRAYRFEQYVAIEVTDTGKGIAVDNLERIFDLFYTTREDGTGFGLWSARRYARANRGDLIVKSVFGAGATFILLLPSGE
jgi:GAF domain-containing protein